MAKKIIAETTNESPTDGEVANAERLNGASLKLCYCEALAEVLTTDVEFADHSRLTLSTLMNLLLTMIHEAKELVDGAQFEVEAQT